VEAAQLLKKLVAREDLTREQTRALVHQMMDESLDPRLMAALLATMAVKGETVDEIVGAAQALRDHLAPVRTPAGVEALDTCGTGGDGQPIFNVSTAVAVVAAAAGATVAKHGNRSNVRPSGSAEVLGALGVNLDANVPALERCLQRCGIAFLFAVRLHPAMKHAAPVRRALGIRTIFNLVGPLANPAGVRRQLLGVNRPELVETMIEALRRLGTERVMVVHGMEGLCDLSVSGPSRVARWDGQSVSYEDVDCGVIDAKPGKLEELYVTDPRHSAGMIHGVFDGQTGLPREMVVFNAAAALWVAGLTPDWPAGAALARELIGSGKAREKLDNWVSESHAQA